MDIIVCIKQVPGTTGVNVDPETGILIRDGIESKMNPFDLFALETSLRLKEEQKPPSPLRVQSDRTDQTD